MDWSARKCVPCEGGTPRLTAEQAAEAARSLDGWEVREDGTRLAKRFEFRDFTEAMRFANAMAAVAEAEGHHPDFLVHRYKLVDVTLSTHAVGGLSENDFVLAAKLDARPESRKA
jgi:4a-hydroxytetrahydrobiopterin dehydratase